METDLTEILKKNVYVQINGRRKRVTQQDALLLRMFDRGARGDTSAALKLIKTVNELEKTAQPTALAEDALSPVEEAIVNDFLRRHGLPPAVVKATRKEFDAILRQDLLAFAYKCFDELHPSTSLSMNWHHEALCNALTSVANGDTLRLVINLAPRLLKSLFASIALPAHMLGKDPTKKIICVSYSQDLALLHASHFRKIVQSAWYRRIFSVDDPTKDTEAEYQTSSGGFRLAISVGGSLTGRGGNLIIIDDPVSAQEAYSDASRNKVNDWFRTTLLSRLDDKNKDAIIIVMQRLHQEDLSGFVLEAGGWDSLVLPATAQKTTVIPLPNGRQHTWLEGDPLDPERLSNEFLEDEKRRIGSLVYAAQYDQQPVPAAGNMLKREWLKFVDQPPVRQKGDEIIVSVDTAMKATPTAAYSVFLTFLVRNSNQYYLIDIVRERLEFPQLVHKLVSHAARWKPNAMLIENKASGISLIQELKHRGIQGVVPCDPDTDKKTRMLGRTAMIESGSLILVRSVPATANFELEFLGFPNTRYMDQMDALSQFLTWLANRGDVFEFDFGNDTGGPGAPSPDDILGMLGRW